MRKLAIIGFTTFLLLCFLGLAHPAFKQYNAAHLEIQTAPAALLYHFHQDGWVEQVPIVGNHSFDVKPVNHPDAWIAVLVFNDRLFYYPVNEGVYESLVDGQKIAIKYTQERFHKQNIKIEAVNFSP